MTAAGKQPEAAVILPAQLPSGYPLARLISFLGLIAVILALYTGERLEFLLANRGVIAEVNAFEVLHAFLMGVRFDLSFVLTFSSPFLLLVLAPLPKVWVNRRQLPRWFVIGFLAVHAPLLIINFADAHYFRFSGRRSSFDVLRLSGDIAGQAGQLLGQYWFIPAASLAVLCLTYLAMVRLVAATTWQRRIGWLSWSILFLSTTGLTVIGNRGGWQGKPLRPSHAYTFSNMVLGDVALSTPYVLMRTKSRESVPRVGFFAGKNDVDRLTERDRPLVPHFARSSDNVVIIILESLGTEFMGNPNDRTGLVPFFESLSRRGLFFVNNYANGRRSIEAPPSILAGVPALMDGPYVTSRYVGNRIHGIGEVLGERGYRTMFFHGGKNGTMFFDLMSRLCGFKEYYGKNEYPDEKDFDGAWGIYDGPFLQFMLRRLDATPQPFAATVFTLSSHNPFPIPADFAQGLDPNLTAFQRSLRYTDHALAEFFRQAEKSPWYKNTLFILTADHTAESTDPAYQTPQGRFRVPLLFFHGGGRIAAELSPRITQHADVFPSILDFLGITAGELGFRLLPFGRSIFDETRPGQAINQVSGSYWLQRDSQLASFRFADKSSQGDATLGDTLRAYIQLYNNGINDKSWYDLPTRPSNAIRQ